MPVTSTASLKKGSQTVLGAYRGATPAYNVRTFYRDFASFKTLNHGIGPAINFTRSSTATYFNAAGVLTTAQIDEPRFDHSGGTSLGLLIEEQRTNRTLYSEDFGDAAWVKTGGRVVITTNQIIAPDGNLTADFAEANGGASGSRLIQQTDVASSTGKSLSVFAKAGTASFLQLSFGADTAPWANFNLSAGTVESAGTVLSATITPVGNGWYRCQVSTSSTTATNATFAIVSSGAAARAESNTLSSGLYIWGAQLEAGTFATSYIPTTTAAATRSTDIVLVEPVSSFYNPNESTMFAELELRGRLPSARYVQFDDTTNDNRIVLGLTSGSTVQNFTSVATGTTLNATVTVSPSVLDAGAIYKIGAAFKVNDAISARNGVLGGPDTSGAMPSGIVRLRLGGQSSAAPRGHWLRRFAYYPKRLTNTLLQQLTT